MRFPALLDCAEVLPRLDQFDAILDARSPAEFALDHLPGAINCPVLDDDERHRVGTLYAHDPFEAKKLGAALVARNIARHLESRFLQHQRSWKPLVYCWRGGNRSGALAHVLTQVGWPAAQLVGGYQAYRRQVVAALAELPPRLSLRIVCGPTGSGKSRLLQALAAAGAQVLDLERLAAHRGSVLGDLPDQPQPTQKAFESGIWNTLRRFDTARVIFAESESRRIGRLQVPPALIEAMRAAPCLSLELPTPARIRLLLQDYAHFASDPQRLGARLDSLTPLHGHAVIAHWRQLAQSGALPQLAAELLERHYDPAYRRSLGRNFSGIPETMTLALDDIDDAALTAAAQLVHHQKITH